MDRSLIRSLKAAVVASLAMLRSAAAEPPCSCPAACQGLPAANAQHSSLLVCPDAAEPLTAAQEAALAAVAGEPGDIRKAAGTLMVKVAPVDLTARRQALQQKAAALGRADVIVEPNHHYSILAPTPRPTPRDASWVSQWALNSPVSAGGCLKDADINALEAWGAFGLYDSPGDDRIVLALVDEGFTFAPDLVPNVWVNEPEREGAAGADDDKNGYEDDVNGVNARDSTGIEPGHEVDSLHGTQVASLMAAVGDNPDSSMVNIAGVVWKTKMVLCATSFEAQELVECLRYVIALKDAGVNIVAVNVSGGDRGCSCCVEREIRRLRDRGILLVAAAGNDGTDNDDVGSSCPVYPASHRVSNVISVAGSTCRDERSPDSNFGARTVHVAAPGRNVTAIDGVSTAPSNNFGGTSAAAPHVTGLIALLKARQPCLDWKALRNLVLAGGTQRPAFADTTISGRRIRAWDEGGVGSMTCVQQLVRRRLFPLGKKTTTALAAAVPLSFLSIDCASSAGPVTVQVFAEGASTPAETFSLADDGAGPDEVAGDGEFAGAWTPGAAGTFTLKFVGADAEALDVDVQ